MCSCSRYDGQRHVLEEASETIDLPTILGTKKGIAALARFIDASGAFTKTGERRKKQKGVRWDEEPDPGPTEEDEDEPEDEDDGGGGEENGNGPRGGAEDRSAALH